MTPSLKVAPADSGAATNTPYMESGWAKVYTVASGGVPIGPSGQGGLVQTYRKTSRLEIVTENKISTTTVQLCYSPESIDNSRVICLYDWRRGVIRSRIEVPGVHRVGWGI